VDGRDAGQVGLQERPVPRKPDDVGIARDAPGDRDLAARGARDGAPVGEEVAYDQREAHVGRAQRARQHGARVAPDPALVAGQIVRVDGDVDHG